MSGHWTDTFSFTTGAVRFADLAYIAMYGDELSAMSHPHTYFSEWDAGTWRNGGKVSWPTAGMCVARQPLQQMCAVGIYGGVRMMGSGDTHEEQIGGSAEVIQARGPLRGVRTIGERVYVVGMNRQAWRRDGVDQWVAIDEGARPPAGNREVVGFEAVDGFSETDIYAAGWDGEIWHYDGSVWQPKPSPTSLVLTKLLCAGDGQVYASGRRGLLLQGRGDTWAVMDHQSTIEDIWDLAWYQDTLYVSTQYNLFTLREGRLHPVDFGELQPETFYHLSAGDGVLWSIGAKHILAFDGQTWQLIDG